MLVTSKGERAGTISGGCLEAEVARKIQWFTRDGGHVEAYRSSFDDDNEGVPYGLGCGGKIWILMEAGDAVDRVMAAFSRAIDERTPSVVVSSIGSGRPQTTSVISLRELESGSGAESTGLSQARRALRERRCIASQAIADQAPELICIPVLPPPRLHIYGAGDDAQPIVRFAAELGWDVTVADGRTHLLKPHRFPQAKRLLALRYGAADSPEKTMRVLTRPLASEGDRAVILTHSYDQDRALLRELLCQPLEYLGILGPLHRTTRLVDEVKDEIGLSREECLARLHAPVGLPLGPGDPAVIALSIVAEIQACASRYANFGVIEARERLRNPRPLPSAPIQNRRTRPN
jgi:xanthine/CO dehydrogenase XdhC/CoxF family maturation factor